MCLLYVNLSVRLTFSRYWSRWIMVGCINVNLRIYRTQEDNSLNTVFVRRFRLSRFQADMYTTDNHVVLFIYKRIIMIGLHTLQEERS